MRAFLLMSVIALWGGAVLGLGAFAADRLASHPNSTMPVVYTQEVIATSTIQVFPAPRVIKVPDTRRALLPFEGCAEWSILAPAPDFVGAGFFVEGFFTVCDGEIQPSVYEFTTDEALQMLEQSERAHLKARKLLCDNRHLAPGIVTFGFTDRVCEVTQGQYLMEFGGFGASR